MASLLIDNIKRKTIVGVAALIGRTFLLQLVTFSATFILTIILSPSAFGTYFLVIAIISILNYFSDIGLAAALIQKKDEPTQEDFVTTFTLQQLLVISAISIFWFASEYIADFFSLNSEGLWLFRALLFSFFLSSLKTIPSIILERKLDFGLKVIPQILENITFYLVAIILALKGLGILCFAYAAIFRGLVGLIAIYIISPWKIKIGIYKKSAKELLSFGIPLQGSSILALFKDDLLIIFLGKILSKTEIGYIGWAKKWSEVALRSIMDSIISVSFPVYARLSHDKEILKKGIEKSLFFSSLLIFPGIIALMLIMKPLIFLIPNYNKWMGALFSFYLFSFSAIMASVSSPLVQVLNALGKAKTTFSLMLFWTIFTWALVPFLVYRIGYNGVAISAFIIAFSGFLPSIVIRKYVQFSLFKPIYKPFASTSIMAISIYFFLKLFPLNLWFLIASVAMGGIIYSLIIFFWARAEILPYISQVFHAKK